MDKILEKFLSDNFSDYNSVSKTDLWKNIASHIQNVTQLLKKSSKNFFFENRTIVVNKNQGHFDAFDFSVSIKKIFNLKIKLINSKLIKIQKLNIKKLILFKNKKTFRYYLFMALII